MYVELSPSPHKVTLCGNSHLVFTSHGHSHLVWAFSSCVLLAWAHGDFGHVYVKLSPPPHKVTLHSNSHLTSTLCGHSHLTSTSWGHKMTLRMCMSSCPLQHTKSPHMEMFTSYPPCMAILTSHGHSHLVPTLCGHEVALGCVCQVVPSVISRFQSNSNVLYLINCGNKNKSFLSFISFIVVSQHRVQVSCTSSYTLKV